MQARGYIEKGDKKYKLGLGFIQLSSQLLNSIELKTEGEPLMRMLSDKIGQTVFLAVREGSEVVYIDKVEQFNSLRRSTAPHLDAHFYLMKPILDCARSSVR
jgi:DNA-binding IclR family transcriptional regulator